MLGFHSFRQRHNSFISSLFLSFYWIPFSLFIYLFIFNSCLSFRISLSFLSLFSFLTLIYLSSPEVEDIVRDFTANPGQTMSNVPQKILPNMRYGDVTPNVCLRICLELHRWSRWNIPHPLFLSNNTIRARIMFYISKK